MAEESKARGVTKMFIAAASTENTINFYRAKGSVPAEELLVPPSYIELPEVGNAMPSAS
eukprot:SAG22_NODE_7202_length_763_cov_0.670181_1_plen_58_part_10